tara:strand:- start:1215 stop:1571 length:357 start_codon:yes stop_codon:yes gene_type:complete
MANEKGLNCYIYKNKGKDYSNGGLSSNYDEVLVIIEGEDIGPVEQSDDTPTVKVVKRMLWGEEYIHVEPLDGPEGVGWMAGGCIVSSSDSRFGEHVNKYPVSLHDRCESQKDYDRMSR